MKHVLMLGSGKTGQSVKNYCQRRNILISFYEDKNPISSEIALKDIDTLIVSPSTPLNHPLYLYAKQHKIDILSDLDLFFKKGPCYIGITGTNGKSTTTALMGHVLKALYAHTYIGGNIGIPVLDLPFKEDANYVIELSSYQLEHAKELALKVAVLLNITPDHLQRHGTMENYQKAKERIFENAENIVLCIDDDYTKNIFEKIKNTKNIVTISVKGPADFWVKDKKFAMYKQEELLDLTSLFLKGEHNYQNVLSVIATLMTLGHKIEDIIAHIKTFQGLEHRQEVVRMLNDATFINDSKATNADATEKALLAYKDFEIYWILGGEPKDGGITSLSSYFKNIKKAYLIGVAADDFYTILNYHQVDCTISRTLDEAIKNAYNDSCKSQSKQKVILFSPACASFDQFQNFEHRGNSFKELVGKIH